LGIVLKAQLEKVLKAEQEKILKAKLGNIMAAQQRTLQGTVLLVSGD
jgi:hypothetical protein